MKKNRALIFFVLSVMQCFATIGRAADAQSPLAKLIQAAKAEKDFTLLGGGGTWGDADGQKLLETGFNKKYGLNVRIKFVPGPAMPDMARRIADEFKAGQKSASDMFLGSESHFVELTRSDALTRVAWRETFPHIPAAMVEMDGRLLREATRYIGVSYNQQLVPEKELPRRLDDLLNPKWKGKIASTPYAASFDRLASVIGLEKTREFLKRFTQNVAGLIRCGEEERLASGEFVLLGLNCGNYEAERAQRQGMPINARVLTDVPIVGYWYVSIPKNSAHPNMATLFAAFLLTPEGQKTRYESVGATAHLIEGTPANKQYKELLAQGIQLKDFTSEYVIKNGKMLGELRDEFQKILQQR
ncbi:MAG TPA: extracellular solute-binding protein [Candidatus Binatia bacterium]|jgi:iron(III) transport system substrate-binding protein